MTTSKTGALSLIVVMLLVALTFVRITEPRANTLNVPPAPPEKPRSDIILASAGTGVGTLWPFKGPSPEKAPLSGNEEPSQVLEILSPDRREALPTSGGYSLLMEAVKAELSEGRPQAALSMFNRDPLSKSLKPHEYDMIRSRIASGFYYNGQFKQALALAKASANRSKDKAPVGAWIAGLSLWQLGTVADALPYFAIVAKSPHADGWTRAAGAYWASRTATRAKNPAVAIQYLRDAARHKYTFYGLIAARALGVTPTYDWSLPALSQKDRQLIAAHPDAGRVFDLVKRGRFTQADRLLRGLNVAPDSKLGRAIYAYAVRENLAGTALQYAAGYRQKNIQISDAGLYPMLAWLPHDNKNDRALVHALIRQESRFKTGAESDQGALGLMQLMPDTARFINASATATDAHILNPKTNVDLGQKYVSQLLRHDAVGQNLFAMAIAYNAGPGNLMKWQREVAGAGDQLLFIESIPASETRSFVERVMANYWIYNARLGHNSASLDAIASGAKPVYRPVLNNFNPPSSFSLTSAK